jgi:beta-lactamase superfamily II metal-dependent hydrolase
MKRMDWPSEYREPLEEPEFCETRASAWSHVRAFPLSARVLILLYVLLLLGVLCSCCALLGGLPLGDFGLSDLWQKAGPSRFPESSVASLPLDASHTEDNLTISYPSSWNVEDWIGIPGGFVVSDPNSDLVIFAKSEVVPINLSSPFEVSWFDSVVEEDWESTRQAFSAEFTSDPIRTKNRGTIVKSIRIEFALQGVPTEGYFTHGTDGELLYDVYSHAAIASSPELLATLQAVVESITLTKPKKVASVSLDGELVVHFIDVGMGDSIFVEFPDGQTMLIDAGSEEAGSTVVSYIRGRGHRFIDYVVSSLPDDEHLGGMPAVFDAFNIGSVWAPLSTYGYDRFDGFQSLVLDNGLLIRDIMTGYQMVSGASLSAVVLFPYPPSADSSHDHDLPHGFPQELEDLSAIIEVTFGATTFLFAGDAASVPIHNASYGTRSEIDVLKIGNHGSASSTDDDLISTLNPAYAVISVGDNKYGFPDKQVLDALKGVDVFRTDEQGTIVMTSDGKKISVNVSPLP